MRGHPLWVCGVFALQYLSTWYLRPGQFRVRVPVFRCPLLHGAADLARRALTARSGCNLHLFATAPSVAMSTDSSSASSTSSMAGSPSMPALGDAPAPAIFSYATINVKSHVPLILDLKLPNFTKWSAFFTAMCGKFGLLGHIDGSIPPRPTDRNWSQPDACVRSWIYGCVDDSVLDLAMEPDQTARALYVAITALFQANQATRAVVLGQEFHTMVQGDLTIDAYAQKMKQTADALRDVGQAVSEPQLVLNLLRGLNPRFANSADIIANSAVLPSFTSAHNTLRLKEIRLASDAKVSSDTALTAVDTSVPVPSPCSSPSCRSTPAQPNRGGSNGGGGKGKGKGKGKGNGGGGRFQQQSAPSQTSSGGRPGVPPAGPWFCMNPWAGMPPQQPQWQHQPQWRPPLAPLPQAHTAFAPPSMTGGWDQSALIASLNQMALQGGAGPSPWVLDTGATSHMAASDGILLSRLPHSPSFITVGNGASILVSSRGTSIIPIADHLFKLNNVLVAPHLVHNSF